MSVFVKCIFERADRENYFYKRLIDHSQNFECGTFPPLAPEVLFVSIQIHPSIHKSTWTIARCWPPHFHLQKKDEENSGMEMEAKRRENYMKKERGILFNIFSNFHLRFSIRFSGLTLVLPFLLHPFFTDSANSDYYKEKAIFSLSLALLPLTNSVLFLASSFSFYLIFLFVILYIYSYFLQQ